MIPKRLTKKYVAICEGKADEETFRRLVSRRGIRNIEFISPSTESGLGRGKGAFFEVLATITTLHGFENVSGVILLQDSDQNSNTALTEMKAQIRKANRGFESNQKFGIPDALLTPSFTVGRPPILCATVPWIDEQGALENLILPAVRDKFHHEAACLDDFVNCTGHVNGWNVSKQGKMQLASLIASVCNADPTTSIVSMWSKEEFRDLLDSAAFDQLATFFRTKAQYFRP